MTSSRAPRPRPRTLVAATLLALAGAACGAAGATVEGADAPAAAGGQHAWAVDRCESEGLQEARLLAPEPAPTLERVARTSAAALARWDRPRHGAPDATSPWDDARDDQRIAVCTFSIERAAVPGVAPGPEGRTTTPPDRIVVVVTDEGDARIVTSYNAATARDRGQRPEDVAPPGERVSEADEQL